MFSVAVYLVFLVVLTSQVVFYAAEVGLLVPSALAMAAVPILGLTFLRPGEELAGWALFTLWLGSTYAAGGDPFELAGFAVVAVLAAIGAFRSPWFLAGAWLAHIPWDFVPRELPEMFLELPAACMLFDGLIGGYLVWRNRSGRWRPSPAPPPRHLT